MERNASAGNDPLVLLTGLTKTYTEGDRLRTVLDDLDAVFGRGDLIVLLGRSGSGKSTLLNLVSGIDVPTSGTVSIADTDVTGLSERDRTLFRRRHIGFVFQSFNLIPTLSVLENLLLPMELIGRSGRTERARDLLRKVGLADRADTFPDRLSGGERQRVAIARALAHEPLLILADEPTGNLDFETGSHVMNLLESLVRDHGATMIVATHDRDVVPRANRVVQLRAGKIEESSLSPGRGEPGRGEPRRGEPRRGEPGRGEPGREEPGREEPGRGHAGSLERGEAGLPGREEAGSPAGGEAESPARGEGG